MPNHCAAAVCRANRKLARPTATNVKLSFFSFPRDKQLRKIWIESCKRSEPFNVEAARMCSRHFCSEDFDRDLKAELLNEAPRLILKRGAIPSLYLTENSESDETIKINHTKKLIKNKQFAEEYIRKVNAELDLEQHVVVEKNEEESRQHHLQEACTDVILIDNEEVLKQDNLILKYENSELKKQLLEQEKQIKQYKRKISYLQAKLLRNEEKDYTQAIYFNSLLADL